jgi:hypothetical protein
MVTDHLMQRAQNIRTQLQCHRGELSAQVVEARRLRRQMAQLLQDLRTTLAPHDAFRPH